MTNSAKTFKIALFEEVHKIISSSKKDALQITYILLRYRKTNYPEIYEELYFALRAFHWGPEDCDGLAVYWLQMMDNQTVDWWR